MTTVGDQTGEPTLSRAQGRFLARPMRDHARPSWPGARWVGVVDDVGSLTGELGEDTVALADAEGYQHARLLVRANRCVRGFVEVDVVDGRVSADEVRRLAADLPAADQPVADHVLETITVVICTRDRPELLREALTSVLALEYPAFDVLVVDNAPSTTATHDLVAAWGDPRLRVVTEPRPGLSVARNRGLREATGDVVAFTDDDVVVDPDWLCHLSAGFARAHDVQCVTGLVPSGELRTPVQAYFDQRVAGWAGTCQGAQYSLRQPPGDSPLFPFDVGRYGTGANFALRRRTAVALGGFDEALGVGTPTLGGEDIDMFVRVVSAGHVLAREPSAVVWHRHRAETDALLTQAVGYGVGLGAWLTKVALDRRLQRLALGRAGDALRRVRGLGDAAPVASDAEVDPELRAALAGVGRAERAGVLRGPARYLRARRAGGRARPLA